VVRWGATTLGSLEHEGELVAHAGLAGELAESAWTQCCFDPALVIIAACINDSRRGVERRVGESPVINV
jgi:hypothetical protein